MTPPERPERPDRPAGLGGPLGPLGRRVEAAIRAVLARDWAVLGLLLVLAALLRFTGLESRGRFDGDQGHDVLVLLRLVRDGTLPLLGPPTIRANHQVAPTAATPRAAIQATTAVGFAPVSQAAGARR